MIGVSEMSKNSNSRLLEFFTLDDMLEEGHIQTLYGIPVPKELREIKSSKTTNKGYIVHSPAEDIHCNGEFLVHIVNLPLLNERLLRMLWNRMMDGVWNIKLRKIIHLQDRAGRDDFSSKEKQFYADLSKGRVCIWEFLKTTITLNKDQHGKMWSKYDTWFSQYVLFGDGSLYRFAISYRFD